MQQWMLFSPGNFFLSAKLILYWRRLTTYDGVAWGAVSHVTTDLLRRRGRGMMKERVSKSMAAEIVGLGFALEIAVALIILAMVFSAAPAVGSMVCVAAEINTSSDWAASDIPSGVGVWRDGATFITRIILLSVMSLAVFYIRMLGWVANRGLTFLTCGFLQQNYESAREVPERYYDRSDRIVVSSV